ncbi:uncharacterized protein LOC117635348 [Prunus dulcis]|uniref:uncharacterized protein LOC117635348 n=1 Tax=Prunus dulcis TaxID=3755 RepID=UPI001483CB57|nr:uncharacterized protein LOC117635348 [Prunus dulcis]
MIAILSSSPIIMLKTTKVNLIVKYAKENEIQKIGSTTAKKCDFDCHPDCVLGRYPQVKLEGRYKHDAHPHLVTLVDKIKSVICFDKRESILPFEACGKPCEGLVFEWSGCNVDIHQSELNCRGREIELEHFSHKNPLMFKDKQINIDSGLVFCFGCANPMLYSSNQYPHGNFTLHKSCAELPNEMQHPLHPMYPLGLLTIGDYTCVVCDQHYKDRLAYNCSQCDFNLDLKCASNWHNIGNYDCHKHKFTVLLKWRMKFTCDVCGQDGHGIAYLCSNCQLLVHKRCTLLPCHIKITAHQHPLMLRWSFEASFQLDDQFCKVCHKPFIQKKKICGVYYCENCNYFAHNTCVIKEDVLDETTAMEQENQDPYAATIETIDHENMILIVEPVHKLNLEQNQLELGVQIKHFSHDQHFLSLSDHHEAAKDISDRITTCHCCIRPITVTDAFYSCTEQQSFLHKPCAQLPTQRLHPFHPHPLKLLSRAPMLSDSESSLGSEPNAFDEELSSGWDTSSGAASL